MGKSSPSFDLDRHYGSPSEDALGIDRIPDFEMRLHDRFLKRLFPVGQDRQEITNNLILRKIGCALIAVKLQFSGFYVVFHERSGVEKRGSKVETRLR